VSSEFLVQQRQVFEYQPVQMGSSNRGRRGYRRARGDLGDPASGRPLPVYRRSALGFHDRGFRLRIDSTKLVFWGHGIALTSRGARRQAAAAA
jgi:hypothetical protein